MVLVVKNPLANAGDIRDMGSIPGLGRSPGGEHPLQYSFFFFIYFGVELISSVVLVSDV